MAGTRKETMPTFEQLVDEVKASLQGYTLRQDRITYVTNASGLTTTSTAITVGSADNLAKGVIEIDDELIWVDRFDKANNLMTVAPTFGRGYQGTTASPHAQYAQVTLSPTFPRVNIKKAINDTIRSLYPKLFAFTQCSIPSKESSEKEASTVPPPELQSASKVTGLYRDWETDRKSVV